MRSWVKDASVTLSGLRVQAAPGEAGGRVYPWTNVAAVDRPRWAVWDENGERVLEGSKPLALRVRATAADIVARRAQKRYIRSALRNGTLRIVDRISHAGQLLTVTTVGLFALAMPVLAVLLLTRSHAPSHWTEWVGAGLIISIMLLLAVGLLLLLLRDSVLLRIDRLEITSDGLRVAYRHGQESFAPWSALDPDASFSSVLRFRDGLRITLHGLPRRASAALRTAREMYIPQHHPARRRRAIVSTVVLLILALAAAAVDGFGSAWLDGKPAWKIAGVMLLAEGALAVSVGIVVIFSPHTQAGQRFWRRCRHRALAKQRNAIAARP